MGRVPEAISCLFAVVVYLVPSEAATRLNLYWEMFLKVTRTGTQVDPTPSQDILRIQGLSRLSPVFENSQVITSPGPVLGIPGPCR